MEIWGKVMFSQASVILFTGWGMHPLEDRRSTSGRYASYWNAFLLSLRARDDEGNLLVYAGWVGATLVSGFLSG